MKHLSMILLFILGIISVPAQAMKPDDDVILKQTMFSTHIQLALKKGNSIIGFINFGPLRTKAGCWSIFKIRIEDGYRNQKNKKYGTQLFIEAFKELIKNNYVKEVVWDSFPDEDSGLSRDQLDAIYRSWIHSKIKPLKDGDFSEQKTTHGTTEMRYIFKS